MYRPKKKMNSEMMGGKLCSTKMKGQLNYESNYGRPREILGTCVKIHYVKTNLWAGLLLLHGKRPNKYFSNFSVSIKVGSPSMLIRFPDGNTNEFEGNIADDDIELLSLFDFMALPPNVILAEGLRNRKL